jgi:CBS-domain-containing membrane protein
LSVRLRGGLLGELALALLPTLTIIVVLFFVEALTRQRILFASLASSAFLIYREPERRMNTMRVMIAAHIVAVVTGTASGLVLGSGYIAAALAMTLTIFMLIVGNVVHPPAIATALGFAFYSGQYETVGVFLLALFMLAVLAGLQRAAIWSLARVQPGQRAGDASRSDTVHERV